MINNIESQIKHIEATEIAQRDLDQDTEEANKPI